MPCIRNAFPDIPVSWISGEDCARIAVTALLSPEKFADGPAVYPGSPHQYTQSEIADTIGRFIGKSLRHESLSIQVWQDRIVASSVGDRRVNADMAHHIASVAAALHQMPPLAPNNMIEHITGVRPISLSEALLSGKLRF